MKIREAIRLLQQQDPEADLCVFNHEFSSWDDAEYLCKSDGGDFMFSDGRAADMEAELLPTEVSESDLNDVRGRIQMYADQATRFRAGPNAYLSTSSDTLRHQHEDKLARLLLLPRRN